MDDVLTRAFGSLERPTVDNPYAADYVRAQARAKYGIDLPLEHIRIVGLHKLRNELIGYQEKFLRGGHLDSEIDHLIALSGNDEDKASEAFTTRFGAVLMPEDANRKTSLAETNGDGEGHVEPTLREKMIHRARQLIRQELTDLEQVVLIQILDQAWKDHLYAMDMLRGGVGLAGFAEKDPRIVYKKEGFAYFEQMLSGIRDKTTDLIFRVRLEGATQARSQYREVAAVHEETGGYGVAENLLATAEQDQPIERSEQGGDDDDAEAVQKVATIVRDAPKVGRNDLCPCGSGKKYKKCHGANMA